MNLARVQNLVNSLLNGTMLNDNVTFKFSKMSGTSLMNNINYTFKFNEVFITWIRLVNSGKSIDCLLIRH